MKSDSKYRLDETCEQQKYIVTKYVSSPNFTLPFVSALAVGFLKHRKGVLLFSAVQ